MVVTLLMRRRVRLGLFVACSVLLLYGLFRPQSPPDLFAQSDKWLHLIAFMAFAGCARLAFVDLAATIFWPLLIGSAPLLEYLQQALQPLRVFSLEDAAANLTGVLLAALVWCGVVKPWVKCFIPQSVAEE